MRALIGLIAIVYPVGVGIVHHSPWFWLGEAMFMAVILTYVFSENLSLRPRRHAERDTLPARADLADAVTSRPPIRFVGPPFSVNA
jgi:hypothetical protein